MLFSSLWVSESKETRLVWVTLLMLKNSEGIIQASVVGLADAAKVSPDECKEALRVLLSPDPDDTSKVEEGRRIREVPGGWQIVNHDQYRFSTEAKREFWKQQKAEQRAKLDAKQRRPKRGKALAGEKLFVDAEARGDERGAEAVLDEVNAKAAARAEKAK